MPLIAIFCLIGLVTAGPSDDVSVENWIRGRIVDESGKPVADASVGPYWSANGLQKKLDGSDYDLTKREEQILFWGNLGRMEPVGKDRAVTGADGLFAIEAGWRRHFVTVMDLERKRGGIGIVKKGHESEPIEIRLRPLIHVKGRIEGPEPGVRPLWTNVYTQLPEDPERPTDSFRISHCGSFEARFEMFLPPGTYQLHAYAEEGAEALPWPTITLSEDRPEVDVGVLKLEPGVRFDLKVAKLKEGGSWGDFTKHYGKRPPRIFAQDSRGVPHDFQLWDKPGKWVLVEFWGLDCAPCLGRSLPKLMKFQEEHEADRDRFEIVTVFIDVDEKIKTMADLDKGLKPVVDHVWNGKSLPFPILLDSGFKTWESYGLPGLGTMILIDPDGNLVKGDLERLEEILKKR
jgi:thiol-disulfide isomerase/thioredoxin